MMHKAWCSTDEVPYCFSRSSIKFQGHMDRKIDDFNPILSKITRLVAAIKSLRFALFKITATSPWSNEFKHLDDWRRVHIWSQCHVNGINDADTKWLPFSRRHFQMDFVIENAWISIKIPLKFVPRGQNNNIPVPTRRQAINWTNDALVGYWHIFALLGLNELT